MVRILLPKKLEELWQMMEDQPQSVIYAGGTDLFVRLRQNLIDPPSLICLERIEELKGVHEQGDEVIIGACSTHTSLLENPIIQRNFPVLKKALNVLGSPLIRNMGTIGGNICSASPAADTLPPLYVLKAEVEIRSRNAQRHMTLGEFILRPGKTCLKTGEIVFKIGVRKTLEYNVHHFEKVGQRHALSIALVSLAAILKVSNSGIIEKARLAWGSVGPAIVTSPRVEEALIGQPLSRETLLKTAPLAHEAVTPIDDIRASASYRRSVSGNLLLRLLEAGNAEAGNVST